VFCIKFLGWTMRKMTSNENMVFSPSILVLLTLLCIFEINEILPRIDTDPKTIDERVFVQVSGGIKRPGVYGFGDHPKLEDVLNRAGGLNLGNKLTRQQLLWSQTDTLLRSGNRIDVLTDENRAQILVTEMPSYYKITLGLPLSLNRESLEGLTAVSGIGHKTAKAIVSHRARVGGFKRVEEILSISGIGPSLYYKIRPYLDL